eukprot:scpid73069/ scgid17910/ 
MVSWQVLMLCGVVALVATLDTSAPLIRDESASHNVLSQEEQRPARKAPNQERAFTQVDDAVHVEEAPIAGAAQGEHVHRRAAPTQNQDTAASTIPPNTARMPDVRSSSLNTVLLITVIVAVLVCFLLGIFVAFLCIRSMRASAKDGNSSSFPFKPPGDTGQDNQGYRNEEQIELYNYQSRMAQMQSNLKMNRGMTPYGSGGEDLFSGKEDYEVIEMSRDTSPDVILGTYGPAQVTSARIVNPVFDTERHGSPSSLTSRPSTSLPPSAPTTSSSQTSGRKHRTRRGTSVKEHSSRGGKSALKRSSSTPDPGSTSSERSSMPSATTSHTSSLTTSSQSTLPSSSSQGSSSTPLTAGSAEATAAAPNSEGGSNKRRFQYSEGTLAGTVEAAIAEAADSGDDASSSPAGAEQ